jgi:hypothetical protein
MLKITRSTSILEASVSLSHCNNGGTLSFKAQRMLGRVRQGSDSFKKAPALAPLIEQFF